MYSGLPYPYDNPKHKTGGDTTGYICRQSGLTFKLLFFGCRFFLALSARFVLITEVHGRRKFVITALRTFCFSMIFESKIHETTSFLPLTYKPPTILKLFDGNSFLSHIMRGIIYRITIRLANKIYNVWKLVHVTVFTQYAVVWRHDLNTYLFFAYPTNHVYPYFLFLLGLLLRP